MKSFIQHVVAFGTVILVVILMARGYVTVINGAWFIGGMALIIFTSN